MAREIWWIRHGETEWNSEGRWQGHSESPLSALGQRQAQALGRRLEGVEFDGVFSSDLGRAEQTARLSLPGREPTLDARLREIHFGEFEGVTREELSSERLQIWDAWWRDPFRLRMPAGESMSDLSARLEDWQSELPREGRFAVFTHGGCIRCVLWSITGPPREGAWSVMLDNASLTKVRAGSSRIIIQCVNDSAHLPLK